MKPLPLGLAAVAIVALALQPASAQSIGRIKRSLDRATGQQPQAPAQRPGQVAPAQPAPPLSPAAAAAAKKRDEQAAAEADKRVVEFLKQRVKDGSADAAYDLGVRYRDGRGVAADAKESRRLLELAAERGNSDAKQWLKDNPAPKAESDATTPSK
jgi:TPR repeat protein